MRTISAIVAALPFWPLFPRAAPVARCGDGAGEDQGRRAGGRRAHAADRAGPGRGEPRALPAPSGLPTEVRPWLPFQG